MDLEGLNALLPWLLMSAGPILLAVVLVCWQRRHPTWLIRPDQTRDLERQVDQLRRELDTAGRRIDNQVELRMGELRRLLDQADLRIAQLRCHDSSSPGPSGAGGAGSKDRVLQLSRQGQGPEQIARQTGLDVGEVELILNLERTIRRSASADAGG